ncbi:MAG TPA: hypothetical protein PLW86_06970, partial [Rhodocyclaceae bacterium]|nr:hypothetical protein [Rhodocyclaceae bacterium]
MALLVLSQSLGLQALLLALSPLLLAGQSIRKRWWGLVWRARILLLTLALVISYSVPGLLWAGYAWAPSHEGLLAAAEQVLRLLLLFAALAVLLQRLSREELLAALWSLLRVLIPKSWVDQSLARLALVLRYVEDAPRDRSWRHLIFDA